MGTLLNANERELKLAREIYGSTEIEIDDTAQVSQADDGSGTWVQAWVWLSADQLKETETIGG